MKIAVVGSNGYLGNSFIERFTKNNWEIMRIGRGNDAFANLNLEHAETFTYEVLNGVDFLIFTAAISGPDKCASDYSECWKINVSGTVYFIQQAIHMGCKVIFCSSDAVYASRDGEIYDEDSPLEPCTAYGKMKQAVELSFKGQHFFKAIRLSYVLSGRDKFLSYLFSVMKSRQKAKLFHPFYRNVIILDDVLQSTEWLLQNWQAYEPQALCLNGEELISRIRIVDEFNCLAGSKISYMVVKPESQFFLNRPSLTQMRSRYLYSQGILSHSTFTQSFQKQMKGMFS